MTVHAGVPAIDRTVVETLAWLDELAELADAGDRQQAYRIFAAVLHALRDRLPAAEVVDLGAQLPMLVRGIWYDGWGGERREATSRRREEFLAEIRERLPDGRHDPERAARAVFELLTWKISAGEIDDVAHVLPRQLRALWPGES